MGYWYTLTHTPLYVTDRAEQEANNANRIQISDNQRILSEIDSASALHLNEKEIKKQVSTVLSRELYLLVVVVSRPTSCHTRTSSRDDLSLPYPLN